MGKGYHLGELEELVLMISASLDGDAYGVSVMDELKAATGRTINVSAIHAVLKRLEQKGYVSSYVGGATNERGGRRKRLFEVTASGKKILKRSMEERVSLFRKIPGFSLDNL